MTLVVVVAIIVGCVLLFYCLPLLGYFCFFYGNGSQTQVRQSSQSRSRLQRNNPNNRRASQGRGQRQARSSTLQRKLLYLFLCMIFDFVEIVAFIFGYQQQLITLEDHACHAHRGSGGHRDSRILRVFCIDNYLMFAGVIGVLDTILLWLNYCILCPPSAAGGRASAATTIETVGTTDNDATVLASAATVQPGRRLSNNRRDRHAGANVNANKRSRIYRFVSCVALMFYALLGFVLYLNLSTKCAQSDIGGMLIAYCILSMLFNSFNVCWNLAQLLRKWQTEYSAVSHIDEDESELSTAAQTQSEATSSSGFSTALE